MTLGTSNRIYLDQIGHEVNLPVPPCRIISLVPSQTELLFSLELEENIVGISKFCVHPRKALKCKTKVGGTKKFNLKLIRDLSPDLIIANKEENYLEGIKALQKE